MELYVIENNVNGKRYVGITKRGAEKRWREHLRASEAGSTFALHKAMAKYGKESFSVVELKVAGSLDELRALEVAEIARLNTFGPRGYNMTAGGDGTFGFRHTPEEVEARRVRRTGTKHTEEAKAKIQAAHKDKRLSPEHIAALVKANTGRAMSEAHKDVLRNQVVSDEEREARKIRATGNKWSLGIKRTPEQCEAIGARSRGKVASEETKDKIRKARALQEPTYGMLGKSHNEDTKAKMSAAKIGKKKSPETIERMKLAAAKRWADRRLREANA